MACSRPKWDLLVVNGLHAFLMLVLEHNGFCQWICYVHKDAYHLHVVASNVLMNDPSVFPMSYKISSC
jgi:hypothetical protein